MNDETRAHYIKLFEDIAKANGAVIDWSKELAKNLQELHDLVFSDTLEGDPFWVSWPVEQAEAPRTTDDFNSPRPEYGAATNRLHEGMDCDAYVNAQGRLANILAAQDGVVEYAVLRVDDLSYGYHVAIRHPWGDELNRWRTLYGHLSSIAVKVGDQVKRGQKIGVAGRTGTKAIHLHFGVYDAVHGLHGYVRCRDCSALWPDGVIDPMTVLKK